MEERSEFQDDTSPMDGNGKPYSNEMSLKHDLLDHGDQVEESEELPEYVEYDESESVCDDNHNDDEGEDYVLETEEEFERKLSIELEQMRVESEIRLNVIREQSLNDLKLLREQTNVSLSKLKLRLSNVAREQHKHTDTAVYRVEMILDDNIKNYIEPNIEKVHMRMNRSDDRQDANETLMISLSSAVTELREKVHVLSVNGPSNPNASGAAQRSQAAPRVGVSEPEKFGPHPFALQVVPNTNRERVQCDDIVPISVQNIVPPDDQVRFSSVTRRSKSSVGTVRAPSGAVVLEESVQRSELRMRPKEETVRPVGDAEYLREPGYMDGVPVAAGRVPEPFDMDYSNWSPHTNDGSVIERRFARQIDRMEAMLSKSKSGKRDSSVRERDAHGDPDDGSSSSSSDVSGRRDARLPPDRSRKKKPVVEGSSEASESEKPEFGDVIARTEKCRKGRRESAFLSYADDREIRLSERSNATQRQEGLSVRQLPDAKDLWLKTFDVLDLLRFEEKYTLLQQDWVEPLRIAKHMNHLVRNRIENEASMLPKYESILKGRSILDRGKQLLNNEQIWEVVKKIVEPISAEEVRRILSLSVYPVASYKKFKDPQTIMVNFSEFRNCWTNYDRMFMNLINLILGKRSRKYFPQTLLGGSDEDDAKDKGWIQYYFEGSPNSGLVHRLYKKEIPEGKRKACREFNEFRALFSKALMQTETRLRMELSSIAVFDEDDGHLATLPPVEWKPSAGKSPKRSASHPLLSERGRGRDHRAEDTPEREGGSGGSESSGSEVEAELIGEAERAQRGATGVKPALIAYTSVFRGPRMIARKPA